MNQTDLKEFLDTKVELYNTTRFIKSDPILIPHQLRDLGAGKEDIEIISFLVATIAWGNRKSIITNGNRLVKIMGNSPFDFITNFTKKDSKYLSGFVHRTFNENDLNYFIIALQNIYLKYRGMESLFLENIKDNSFTKAMLISRNTLVVNLTAFAVLQLGISISSTEKTKL